MAAAAAPTPDTGPRITHEQAAFHTNRQAEGPLLQRLQREKEIKDSLDLAAAIKARRKPDAPPDGKADIAAARAEARKKKADLEAAFDDNAQKEMTARFGGGRSETGPDGKLKKTGGEPDIQDKDKDLTDDEKKLLQENLKNGEKKVDDVGKVLKYLDIVQRAQAEADRTGRDYLEVLDEIGSAEITGQDFLDFRDQSLDVLVNNPAMQQLFRKQFDTLSTRDAQGNFVADEQAQRDFVDVYFMSDPNLRQEILKRMNQLKTKRLTEEKKDELSVEAEEAKKKAEPELRTRATEIANAAKALGIKPVEVMGTDPTTGAAVDLTNENFIKDIEDQIKEGATVKEIVEGLRAQVLEEKGLKEEDIKLIEKYNAAKKEVDDLNKQLEAIQRGSVKATKLEEDRLKGLIETKEKARDKIKDTEIRTGADDTAKDTAWQNFEANSATYDSVVAATSLNADQRGYTGKLAADVAAAVNAADVINKSDKTIAERKVDAEKALKASRARRQEEESNLLDALDDVVSESVFDVLEARIDDMNKVQEAYAKEQEAEAIKQGDAKKAEYVAALAETMRDRWIKYDEQNGSKEVKHGNIKADIRYLIYNGDPNAAGGDPALQRLILRDIGIPPQGIDPNADREWWRNVQLTDYDEKTRAQFQDIYTKMGKQYQDKLFISFITERTMRDKLTGLPFVGGGQLALQDHEWKLLSEKYQSAIMGGVQEKKAAKQRMAQLESEGVLIDGKSKLLWSIFAALGVYAVYQTGGAAWAAAASATAIAGAANADSIGNAVNARG